METSILKIGVLINPTLCYVSAQCNVSFIFNICMCFQCMDVCMHVHMLRIRLKWLCVGCVGEISMNMAKIRFNNTKNL
jgi:hypothetical protein